MNLLYETGEVRPDAAEMLAGAVQLHRSGRIYEAIKSYQRVLELAPESFDALHLLGQAAYQIGERVLAEKLFCSALTIRPASEEALNDLGLVLLSQGKLQQALDCFLNMLELCPQSPQAYANVATALCDMGRTDEAMQCCQAALALQPDFVPAHLRLGMIHYKLDDLAAALESFSRAHRIAPHDADVLNLLAAHKIARGRPDEAMPFLDQVLLQSPGNEDATGLLQKAAAALQDGQTPKEACYSAGLIDRAEELAREDLSRENSVENHNFLLKCYLASDKHSALHYFRESREWSRRHAHEELLPSPGEFTNERNPERRLKVGIVGDYFDSVIGAYTLYPFFRAYDRDQLEVHCYNFGNGERDIRPIVDRYRDIRNFSDEELFRLIRHDAIDILLDINGRIRTPNYFATLLRQPAPIQINWYNLPCTVGVRAYNYAITDEYCVRDREENVFIEKIFRMPTGMICAWDLGEPPAPSPPPCERNGYVTFGCFGDFFKVNPGVLATWADLLMRVPHSRLYLKSNNLRLPAERERVSELFRKHGVDPARIELEGISVYNQMKKCYGAVDIALDTFPYSNGSTTINALWQGVPVVAFEGGDWRGRSSAAVLAGCGLEELIAHDVAGYIDMAAALASAPGQLAALRAGLGKRLAASPQWRVDEFSRNFESRLRMIWQDWLRESA